MKRIASLLLALVLLAGLAATAYAYAPAENAQDFNATLRYTFWDESQREGMTAQIEAFKQYYPNINVELEISAWDPYWEKIQVEAAGGTCADIFMNQTWWFKTLQDLGIAESLTPYVERDGVSFDGHLQQVMDIYSEDGQLYALPRDWDTECVIYNKDLFDKYGVEYPTGDLSWNPVDGGSYLEMLRKMTIDASGNNALSDAFDPNNIATYGGIVYNSNNQFYWNLMMMNGGNIADYTTEKNIQTMQWAQDLILKYHVSPAFASVKAAGADVMFASGNIASYTDGNWCLASLIKNCGFNVGIAKLPSGPDGLASLVNGIGESIYSGSPNKDAAWEFLKFLTSDEGQKILADHGTVLVSREAYWPNFFQYYVDTYNLDASAYMDMFTDAQHQIAPLVPHWTEKSDAINKNYDLLFLGQIDSATAAANIGEAFASIGE